MEPVEPWFNAENLKSTIKTMQDIVDWRATVVGAIDLSKTILAFKSKENSIPVRTCVVRAGPLRKDLEERAHSKTRLFFKTVLVSGLLENYTI